MEAPQQQLPPDYDPLIRLLAELFVTGENKDSRASEPGLALVDDRKE